jgi:hypothetical protein
LRGHASSYRMERPTPGRFSAHRRRHRSEHRAGGTAGCRR